MYANIFTFIAALSLFSFYEVPKENPSPVLNLILAIIFFYLLFFLLCRRAFRIPKTAQSFDRSSLSLTKSSLESLVNRYTVIALFFYSIIVCVFNLKEHLLSFFLLKTSSLALCLVGAILPLFLFFSLYGTAHFRCISI
jgi:hypothetical protein